MGEQRDNYFTWNINSDSSLPRETRTDALMCTFGTPSDNGPYYITQPFRFIHADRQQSTGENSYIFNTTVPEGAESDRERNDYPYHRRWRWSTDAVAGAIFAAILGLILVLAGLLYCLSRKKKQRKAQEAMLADSNSSNSARDAGAAESGIAGVSSKEKNEQRAEGEPEEEGLPRYEGPPGYAEATSSSASATSVEATTSTGPSK